MSLPRFPEGGFPTALLAYGLVIRVMVMNDFRSRCNLPKNTISGLKWTTRDRVWRQSLLCSYGAAVGLQSSLMGNILAMIKKIHLTRQNKESAPRV